MDKHEETFEEFWDEYVRHHQNPRNRALHLVGTSLALLAAGVGIAKRRPLLVAAAPVIAYGFSVCGHIFFEGSLPMSLSHPVRAVLANFKMIQKMMDGSIEAEVARVQRRQAAAAARRAQASSHLN